MPRDIYSVGNRIKTSVATMIETISQKHTEFTFDIQLISRIGL